MSSFDPIFAATEAKYNLPPGILKATAQVESHFNPKAVSPQGALGIMQMLPATAKGLSANPYDVPQAIDGAGRLWSQNLKASGGDIDRAAMMYHGGTDTRNWGPKTHAYPGKLAAALGPSQAPQQGGGDPIEAALSGQPVSSAPAAASPAQQADPNDPIESALAGSGQDRSAEIASAQAQAAKQLASGDEKGAIATLAQHNLQMAPGELDAFHSGKRSPGFNHVDQLPTPTPHTDQGLGFLEGLSRPIDNAAVWLEHGFDKVGLAKPINSLASSMGMAPSAEAANANQQTYFQGREAQGQVPGKLGEFAGEVAGTIPVALATKNPWLAGAGSGALTTKDPNDLKQTIMDAGLGAVGGRVAHAALGAAAGVVAPKVSQAVQSLGGMGVKMTPGQIMGGALRRLEDGTTSIPFIGDLVKNAQRRSAISLNTAVINDRVLAPIKKVLPRDMVGREAVEFADNAVSDAYQTILPKLSVKVDRPFIDNVGQILKSTDELPPDRAAQVQKIINGSFLGRFNRPGLDMSGQTFKEADTKLGQLGREYSSSPDPEQRKMGGIFRDVQSELRGVLSRSNPGHAAELSSINQAFANLVRVEGAAASVGAKGGVFTAPQLASAVKRFDTSARKKATATGRALLQDVSDPASEVLPPTVPDSGSPYRTIGAYLLGGGLGHVSPWAAPVVAPVGLYTKTGQAAFQKLMLAPRTPAEKVIANALAKLKTPAAVAGGYATAETANGR